MDFFQRTKHFCKKLIFHLFAKEFNMGYVIPVSEIPHFPPPHKVFSLHTVKSISIANDLWNCLEGTEVENYLKVAEPFLFETQSVYDEKKNKHLSQIDNHFFRTTITAIRFFEKPSWYNDNEKKDNLSKKNYLKRKR